MKPTTETRNNVTRSGPDRFGIFTYKAHGPSASLADILLAYPNIDLYEAITQTTLITDWECM